MKKLIALLATLVLLAAAGGAPAQDKDKAPEKAAAAEPAKDTAKTEAKKDAAPAPAAAAAAPKCGDKGFDCNKGDVAWMLTATAFVLLMTVPGLALFYAGMVRTKNALSTMMQAFATFCLIAWL